MALIGLIVVSIGAIMLFVSSKMEAQSGHCSPEQVHKYINRSVLLFRTAGIVVLLGGMFTLLALIDKIEIGG